MPQSSMPAMTLRRHLLSVAVAGAIAALAAQTSKAQEGPESDGRPWRLVLQQQLLTEKTCDLIEVLMFDEYTLANERIIEGKIRCLDGRQFDFVRRHEHQKFELDLCEPAVC